MNSINKYKEFLFLLLKYSSVGYFIFSLLGALFWPLDNLFHFFDLLYFPSFLFVLYLISIDKGLYFKLFVLCHLVFLIFVGLDLYNNAWEIHLNDLLYLSKWSKYGVLSVLSFFFLSNLKQKELSLIVSVFFLFVSLFSILIILNLWSTGEMLQYYFSPKKSALLSNFYEPRVFRLSGTMVNPNDHGVLFTLFAIVFLFHNTLKNYSYALLSIFLVLLSQSRTAFILLVMLLTFWSWETFVKKKNIRIRGVVLKSIIAVSALVVGLEFFNLNYLMLVFDKDILKSNSIQYRINNFFEVFDSSSSSIYTGNGVISNQIEEFGRYLDSEITLLIAQFGLFGLFIWVLFSVLLTLLGVYTKRIHTDLWLCMVVIFFGVSLTNLNFLHPQLAIVFFILLGLSHVPEEISKQSQK